MIPVPGSTGTIPSHRLRSVRSSLVFPIASGFGILLKWTECLNVPCATALELRHAKRPPSFNRIKLRHLTLKNRIFSTAHEPAYSQDGMPKDRYRLYHREKARGGCAMTMTAGSALVAEDSPAAFGNLQLWRDEIVPWMRALVDDCHQHDCKVMIQLTHLGRRTGWNHSDWLPVVSTSAYPRTGPSSVSQTGGRMGPCTHCVTLCRCSGANEGGGARWDRTLCIRPFAGQFLVAIAERP